MNGHIRANMTHVDLDSKRYPACVEISDDNGQHWRTLRGYKTLRGAEIGAGKLAKELNRTIYREK